MALHDVPERIIVLDVFVATGAGELILVRPVACGLDIPDALLAVVATYDNVERTFYDDALNL